MAPLAPLSEKLLGIVREHGRVTVREAVAITRANRNSIKDHLGKLVGAGWLVRRGRGRGTWYESEPRCEVARALCEGGAATTRSPSSRARRG